MTDYAEDRFDGLYVNWIDGQWGIGVSIDPDTLQASLHGARHDMEAARSSWK